MPYDFRDRDFEEFCLRHGQADLPAHSFPTSLLEDDAEDIPDYHGRPGAFCIYAAFESGAVLPFYISSSANMARSALDATDLVPWDHVLELEAGLM